MLKKQFKLFLRFSKFLYPYRKRWLWIIILSGLSSLLALINPYLTKLVVDKAIGNKDMGLFIILALIGGSVYIADSLLGSIEDFLDRYIKLKVGLDLNKKVYRKIQNFSLSWFKDKSTGEHVYKINYDVDRVKDFISTSLPQAISLLPRLIFTLVIVAWLNWRMALLSLCLAPLLYLPPYYFSKKMRKAWQALIENSQEIFKNLDEVFSHIHLVKAFGKEPACRRQYLHKLIENFRISTKNIKLELASIFSGGILSKITAGMIAFYGIYQVISLKMTLGTFAAIMVYLNQLMGLQGQVAYFFQTVVLGLVSCERVDKILSEAPQISEIKGAVEVKSNRPEIIFEDVSFAYRPEEFILKKINFTIAPGKHIALAGPSGCGKSTILNLILRLYDPVEGDIFIGGHNLKELKLSSLRSRVGIALQEPFLWNDTVENNIKYAKTDASKEEVDIASRISGVDEFVRYLPCGYDTIIGENACKVSEGQKQRVAISRAAIKNPAILILDEATASIDSAGEEKIIASLKQAQKDLTLITVSHRLSALMRADLVYYLKSPDTMIIDTPARLLEDCPDFADLFAAQARLDPLRAPG